MTSDPLWTFACAFYGRPGVAADTPLELDGEALELVSLHVDGLPWPAERYAVSEHSLVIRGLPAQARVETVSRCNPAANSTLMGLYEHLEGELDKAGFYHPPEKKPSMVRNLRVPLARARLTDQEVRTFRGVITALSKGRGRVLAKLAEKAAKPD